MLTTVYQFGTYCRVHSVAFNFRYMFSRVYHIHWECFAVLGSLMSNGISCNLELGYVLSYHSPFFPPEFGSCILADSHQ